MTITEMTESCRLPDEQAAREAEARWDSIAKPLHSLGLLEDALVKICAITGRADCCLTPRAVAVFCADNGVVAQGVTQTGQEVTAIVAENMTRGEASICKMAALAGAQVLPVDVGIARKPDCPGLLDRRQGSGTADFTLGPAMTRDQAEGALRAGYDLARELAGKGCRLLAAGEMGIGNTTTSSAVAALLLGEDPEALTGRGAGLSSAGLRRKTEVIRAGIAKNHPDPADPLDVLAKVGGFDLAAMAGFYLGASAAGVPVILDGFISVAAALAAVRLAPRCIHAMIPSHCSGEPGTHRILRELRLVPVIQAGLCLGEGTGAVALMPLLDMAAAVYQGMPTFGEIHVKEYQPLV
ncbi:MAG: nicotinate-nucleotide--dimethylbenzimidazole phosphoribosyltransferase [Angelakisella sp.]|jgi:nicotinate-nucleotide--dimethylbenzimidazole phosphoribosyltransferase|nr:nicotinate-nucleotide--dimethylbenzimidazole phosphoribosyltransferase [Angelakisella sp.]